MTLTETAQLTKRSAIVLTVILLAYLTSQAVWARVKPIIFPPRLPPPEVAFGKLPTPTIPSLPFKEGASPRYVIDTTTGRLPQNLPGQAQVYKIILPKTTLLSSTRAKELAAKLEFLGEPRKISSSEYRWEDADKGRTLNINIATGNFLVETDIRKLSGLVGGSPPSTAAAVDQARNFLQGLESLDEYYREGRKEATYLKIDGTTLKKVATPAEAQLTRVDFFREIDQRPVVGPEPHAGLISVILGKNAIPFVSYYHWPLDPEQSTTYPLKKIEQVWSEVERGEARLVFLAPEKADPFAPYEPWGPPTVYIHQISLGYFDSPRQQNFLQPIYILEGLGVTADRQQLKYIAYLPALASDWVAEEK